jgi:hypothetical protein
VGGHEVNTSTNLGTFTRECGGAGTMGRNIDAPRSFHRRQNGLQAGARRGRKEASRGQSGAYVLPFEVSA